MPASFKGETDQANRFSLAQTPQKFKPIATQPFLSILSLPNLHLTRPGFPSPFPLTGGVAFATGTWKPVTAHTREKRKQGAVMATYAVIDLGSNTVRLLIAQVFEDHPPSRPHLLFQAQEITRLGEGVSQTKRIKEEAAERTISLLARYQETIGDYRPQRLEIVGTEALRDIGGSSTELAQADGLQLSRLASLPLGAVGTQEEFLSADPPTTEEIERMFSSLRRRLSLPFSPFSSLRDHLLVGTAGTITTLASVHLGLREYNPEKVNGLILTHRQIGEIFERLRQLPLALRTKVPGLEAKRADIILSGAAILLVTLKVLQQERIETSDGGLREGLLLSLLGKGD
jgi:exopolyphosphatase/guanosine-5'-triphosphate,3'-diphosphate pyrophosphatase